MTLTELRYIVAVAQERHFGRAAQRCHVSQPTLSIAIKKLEEELALSLFDRSSNEVITTEAGGRIVAQARRDAALLKLDSSRHIAQIMASGDPDADPGGPGGDPGGGGSPKASKAPKTGPEELS